MSLLIPTGLRSSMSFAALPHIHQRLKSVVFPSDPLHIARVILTPGAQGNDVIHMPARAGAAL